MSHSHYSAPSRLFGRIQLLARRWGAGWNRIGGQTRFYARTIGSIGDVLVNYKIELVRLVAQMSLGTGALIMVGGTVVVVGLLVLAAGTITGQQGWATLQRVGIEALLGFVSSFINVRIVAATNRDPEQAVGQGVFRRDLYFRLNVLSLRIPPLRERRQDVPLLAGAFLERLSRIAGRNLGVSDDVMKALIAYDWPGNVRELENCIERCCAKTSGPVIQTRDLPSCRTANQVPRVSAPGARITHRGS